MVGTDVITRMGHTIPAVGLTSLLLLDINVTVTLHSGRHAMAEDKSVSLKRNLGVMGVRRKNAAPGIVSAIVTSHDNGNHKSSNDLTKG